MLQDKIKFDDDHHQLMEYENKLNLFLYYVLHQVMLMMKYLTNVHLLVHLIMDNYIQSKQF